MGITSIKWSCQEEIFTNIGIFLSTTQIRPYRQVITPLTGKDDIQEGQHIDRVRGKMNAFKEYIEVNHPLKIEA